MIKITRNPYVITYIKGYENLTQVSILTEKLNSGYNLNYKYPCSFDTNHYSTVVVLPMSVS